MERLAGWVLGHRLLVALFWVAIAAAGAATAPTTVDRLGYDFALPGQPAYETNQHIAQTYGSGGSDDPLVLVASGDGARERVVRVAAQVAGAVDGSRVVTPDDDGALDAGGSAVAVVYPPVVAGPDPYAAALPAIDRVVAR